MQRNPLYLPELFNVVLDCLAGPYPDHNSVPVKTPGIPEEVQHTLATLARTCRSFSEPSLNRLWCTLDTLEPLALLLASTTKDLVDSRRDTIIRHSRRIQELDVSDDDREPEYLGVLQSWLDLEPNVFPNLKVLRWRVEYPTINGHIPYIRLFLGPNLVDLDLRLDADNDTVEPLFEACSSLCPGLKSIVLNITDPLEVAVTEAFSTGFKKLEYFVSNIPMDSTALRHLFISPQITRLSLTLPHLEARDLSLLPSDIPLPGLKEIFLDYTDIGLIISLLRSRSQGEMVKAGFVLRTRSTHELTLSFLTLLASGTRRSSFRRLLLQRHDVDPQFPFFEPDEDALYNLSYDTLKPLSYFNNLRGLTINLENCLLLNDEQLKDLAAGWPLLEFLSLDCMNGESETHLTFQGLLSLVVACPKLLYLALSLDGRVVPTDDVGTIAYNPLNLRFPRSPIDDPRLVGEFLLKHFPFIRDTLFLDEGDPYKQEWFDVTLLLAETYVKSLIRS